MVGKKRKDSFFGIHFDFHAMEGQVVPSVWRPDVYEEMLDEDCIRRSVQAISGADMLIIGGTSLAVYPAAGFIRYFRGKHLVVINMSATSMDSEADLVIRDPIGQVFREAVLDQN